MGIDHISRTDCLVCPYCGHEIDSSWEFDENELSLIARLGWICGNTKNGTCKCEVCDKEFSFYKEITIYYSTSKLDE